MKNIPEHQVSATNILDVLVQTKIIVSKAQGRRLLRQKALKVNDRIIDNSNCQINDGDILQIGKKRFAKIKKLGLNDLELN